MAKDSLWYRRDVDELDEKWLVALPWASRAVWDELLAWVKLTGQRGKCRAWSAVRFAGARDIPCENVEECMAAAVAAGELVIEDDYWIVTRWKEKQEQDPTAAERKRRQRESEKAKVTAPSPEVTAEDPPSLVTGEGHGKKERDPKPVTESHGVVTRDGCDPVTRQSQSQNSVSNETGEATGGEPAAPPLEPFAEVKAVLTQVCEELGWPEPIDKDIRRRLKPDDALRCLAKLYGVDGAAAMFVHAFRVWKGKTSWEAVLDKRNPLREEMGLATPSLSSPHHPEATLAEDVRNRKKPEYGLDYTLWVPPGQADAIKVLPNTHDPFDENEWRESRGLESAA